jgi:hypothetical protein
VKKHISAQRGETPNGVTPGFKNKSDLRTNPDASHICVKIKFLIYDDSVHKKQYHIFIT